MKPCLKPLLIAGALALLVSPAVAATRKPSTVTKTTTAKPTADPAAQLASLKDKGVKEADRRLGILSKLYTHLGSANKLKPANVATLQSQLQAEATALAQLKQKLAADTDLATAQADIKALTDEYHTFRTLYPEAALMIADNQAANAGASLVSEATQLGGQLDRLRLAGKPVANSQTLFNTAQSQLAEANTLYQQIDNATAAVTPDQFTANAGSLTSQRDKLKQIRADLAAAKQGLDTVHQQVQALNTSAK